MSNQILQVDENMLETKLDRLVSRKVEELCVRPVGGPTVRATTSGT